jgi:predicted phage tail protein
MNQLNVIRIHNPLDPRDHSREVLDFQPGKSLAELFPQPVVAVPRALSINGKMVADDHLALTYPNAGDYVTVCPIPAGDSAKNILRIVAMIALVIVAPQLGGFLQGTLALQGSALALGTAFWTGAVMVAGTVVINSLLPPPKPKVDPNSEGESPTYGIDGPKNTSAEGVVVPVPYGAFRTAGNVIQNFTVNTGDGTQMLYLLINAGEGPIASITDVEINDQPLSSYVVKNAAGDITSAPEIITDRLGTATQEPIKWFADGTKTPITVNQEIVEAWKVVTTGIIDRFRIDLTAPSGLFRVNSSGKTVAVEVTAEIQARRKTGSTTWGPWTNVPFVDNTAVVPAGTTFYPKGAGYTMPSEIIYNQVDVYNTNDGGPIYVGTQPAGPVAGQVYDQATNLVYLDSTKTTVIGHGKQTQEYLNPGLVQMRDSVRNAVRRSALSAPLEEGVYEVRYRRTTPVSVDSATSDKIYVSDLNEIVTDPIAYRNTALLALKIKLGEQITSMPTVTYMNGGRMIKVYQESTGQFRTAPNDNPAWITYDILTNGRYGGGAASSRVPLARWREWAIWCEEQNLTFRGNFDTQSNVWDAANEVARCGRAQIIQVGTRFDVIIDRAEPPSMMFSVANMIEGTFKQNWMSASDRANEIEVSYADKDDGYRQRTVRLYDRAALAAGASQKTAAVKIKGIDNAQRAYEEAQLMLNMNRYILRTVEFSAPIEAIACSVGSVVLVQHDMPQWGYAGRLEAGSTNSVIQFDRPISMEVGSNYECMVFYPALQRFSGTIKSFAGNIVVLNGYSGANFPQMRLKFGAIDRNIQEVVEVGADYGLVVDEITGLSVGNTVELWEVNALVTRSVVNPVVAGSQEFTQVTLSSPMPSAPQQFEKWMFGKATKVAKPFRVKKISGSHEYRRDLVCIEYNESIYDVSGAVPDLDYSDLTSRLVQPAVITGITENVEEIGGAWIVRVTITYRSPQSNYATSEVQIQRQGLGWETAGINPERVTVLATRGESMKFRVIARDRSGRPCAIGSCPEQTYTTQGDPALPGTPSNFALSVGQNGILASWSEPAELDWIGNKLTIGPTALAAVEAFNGKGTQVELPWRAAGQLTAWLYTERAGAILSGTPATASLNIVAPAAVVVQSADLGNGVTQLSWTTARVQQPIKRYILRVGTTAQAFNSLADAATLGPDTLQEQLTFATNATRRVWIQAEDMGGNYGPPSYVDVTTSSVLPPSTNYASVSLYQWSSSQPPVPGIGHNSTYTWATGAHTGFSGSNGWAIAIPVNPGTPGLSLWRLEKPIQATTATTSTVVSWNTGGTVSSISTNGAQGPAGSSGSPGSPGSPGAPGTRYASPSVYRWAATIPTISGSNQFVWATGALSGALPSGWVAVPGPSPSPGFTLWKATVNLVDAASQIDTLTDWSTSAISAVGYAGTSGSSGASVYTATIYRQAASVSAPYGGAFDFATATLTPPAPGYGWSITQPPTTTTPTWACEFTFVATSPGQTVSATTWSEPYIDAIAGQNGSTGAAGQSHFQAEVYLQSGSAPSAPTGGSYTFSTGSLVPPGGWSGTMPASSTTPTYRSTYLFATNSPGTPVSGGTWSSPVMVAKNGEQGPGGAQGASARIAYAKTTLSSLSGPDVTTSGGASFPPDGSWGANGWSGSAPSISAGESVYQTNGIYNPLTAQTVWGTPYLSNLKVGSLSAISANLGAINAGSMNISGRFVVGSDGYLVARGIRIEDEGGSVILSTRSGAGAALPTSYLTPDASWLNSNVTPDTLGVIRTNLANAPGSILNSSLVPSINAAAETANWTQVNSRPTDLAGLDGTRAGKIDGVQAGATVGATIGSNLSGAFTQSSWDVVMPSAFIRAAHIGILTAGNLTVGAVSDTINGGTGGGRVVIDRGPGGANNGGRILIYDAFNQIRVKIGFLG